MKKFLILFSFIVVLFSISCNKSKKVQIPSNKILVVDSTNTKLQQYNEQLILQEDSVLEDFTKKQPVIYKKSNIGIWIYTEKENPQGKPLANATKVKFDYNIYSLDNRLIEENKNSEITFGKKQFPVGLEEGIKLMRTNEKAKFIIPWYLAYAANGKDNTEPYTSLIFEVRTQE